MTRTTRTIDGGLVGPVQLTFDDLGAGRPLLVLHGGAGPRSVAGLVERLAQPGIRVLAPVHPGFDGTPRPESLDSIATLARVYAQLLDDLDLSDVTVVGNSIGGWVAAELALLDDPRVARIVLVDAVGLAIASHPIVDFFSLTLDQVFDLSYFSPDPFRTDPETLTPAQRAAMAGNREALAVYGGSTMADPSLSERLSQVSTSTLVVWGRADRIVPLEHGHAYAAAIPGARLEIIDQAGHLPQLETPEALIELVGRFVADTTAA
jgi:pimeloyl-ACP methyl ester carboxylesterase